MQNTLKQERLLKKKEQKERQSIWLLFLFSFIFLLAGLVSYYLYTGKSAQTRQQLSYVGQLQKLTERVEKNAYLAQSANEYSFKELKESANYIDSILKVLSSGGVVNNLDTPILATKKEGLLELNNIKQSWDGNKALLNSLIEESNNLVQLKQAIEKSVENNQRLTDTAYTLQKSISVLPNPKYNAIVQEITLLLNRITNINTNLFSGENFSLTNGYLLVKDMKAVNYYLNILLTGSEVYDIAPITNPQIIENIKALQLIYYPYFSITTKVADNVSVLNGAKELAKTIATEATKISALTTQLEKVFKDKLNDNDKYFYCAVISFLLLTLSISAFTIRFYRERNKAVRFADVLKENQNNEEAVFTLLKQMGPMKNGDLTQDVHVADKFIEPIARQVNSTREALKSIIESIKIASFKVIKDSDDIIVFSREVLKEADNQQIVIQNSLEQIGQITSEMEDVAQKTYFTTEEAKKSEEMSNDGLDTVNKSIEKMNDIRDNIQESSKKIKRLGESSQAIVRVTDLIRSITKEINVLAFNAAIEATSAGQNGRAFSIMAQEVQRLADKSATASKDIDDLIKNIQEDTAAAVSAMEETTQQVVDGTKLNDNAGYILQEVAKYSAKIASDVEEIAQSIEDKSNNMIEVSVNVRQLQQINKKNVTQINETVDKIDNITKSSSNLSSAVERYKID